MNIELKPRLELFSVLVTAPANDNAKPRSVPPRRRAVIYKPAKSAMTAHSGEGDRPIRPKVITDSGDRDHADDGREGPA